MRSSRNSITDFSIDAILGPDLGLSRSKNREYENQKARRATDHLGRHDDSFNALAIRSGSWMDELLKQAKQTDHVGLDRVDQDEPTEQNCKTRRSRPKKFQCPHCWVALSNSGQYRGHLRIHTGERPYQCDIPTCLKTFTRNEELTRHKRIHTGQRPYECDQCGKRFGRKDHLKKHCNTHNKNGKIFSIIQSQLYNSSKLCESEPDLDRY